MDLSDDRDQDPNGHGGNPLEVFFTCELLIFSKLVIKSSRIACRVRSFPLDALLN
jgi:hypothetical protein